jgi:hypothetical protein
MSSLKKNNLSNKCYDSSARKKPKDEKDEEYEDYFTELLSDDPPEPIPIEYQSRINDLLSNRR